jgi:hypothetical protein
MIKEEEDMRKTLLSRLVKNNKQKLLRLHHTDLEKTGVEAR